MAKNKSKGTILALEISSVYTAIPQIISINKSGEASETYQARTLDGTVHSDQPNNGYAGNPEISGELYYDSGNSVHTFIKTSIRTPPSAGVNCRLTDTAATPLVEIWNVTGMELNEKYATNDGVKADFKFVTSGNPS